MKDPGTFKMLEIVYTGAEGEGVIDQYLLSSLSGEALRNRLEAVTGYIDRQIKKRVAQEGNIKIINLGSGTARDTINALEKNHELADSVSVYCIDNDNEALGIAEQLAKEKRLIED